MSWLWGSADTRPESRSEENAVLYPGYCSHLFNGFLVRMVLNLQLRAFSYTLKCLLKVKEFAQRRECSQAAEVQNVMLQRGAGKPSRCLELCGRRDGFWAV